MSNSKGKTMSNSKISGSEMSDSESDDTETGVIYVRSRADLNFKSPKNTRTAVIPLYRNTNDYGITTNWVVKNKHIQYNHHILLLEAKVALSEKGRYISEELKFDFINKLPTYEEWARAEHANDPPKPEFYKHPTDAYIKVCEKFISDFENLINKFREKINQMQGKISND